MGKYIREFPLKVGREDAQRIIDSCDKYSSIRGVLIDKWSKSIVNPDLLVFIDEDFYKKLRSVHALSDTLNDIFGYDTDLSKSKFKVGDKVTIDRNFSAVTGTITSVYLRNMKDIWYDIFYRDDDYEKALEAARKEGATATYDGGVYMSAREFIIKEATPQEIKASEAVKSPYKNRVVCWCRIGEEENMSLRYATGEINKNGQPLFYISNTDPNKNHTRTYSYHKKAKDISIPNKI